MGIRENMNLSDAELRFFSFMQAHMMSIAVSLVGKNPTTTDFTEACLTGVELGAYHVTDEDIKKRFFDN